MVEDLLWSEGARLLELGVNVVLDYGLRAREERDDYRAKADAVGANVEFHFLDIPEPELFHRMKARNLSGPAQRRADHSRATRNVRAAVSAT